LSPPDKTTQLVELLQEDPFRLTEREYSGFWTSPLVEAVIEDFSQTLADAGIPFPVQHGELMQ
jgi:hypothetical protein